MATRVSAIPEGFHTMTPHLTIQGAAQAMEFYKRAFGAEELMRMTGPGGQGILHAEMRIGNSVFMLNDEFPQQGAVSPRTLNGTPVVLHVYVEDCDAAFLRATQAGAEVVMPPADMFWGDRFAKVRDPFGHQWSVATRKEIVSPEECARRAAVMFGGNG